MLVIIFSVEINAERLDKEHKLSKTRVVCFESMTRSVIIKTFSHIYFQLTGIIIFNFLF
jgi:hypothetical protein